MRLFLKNNSAEDLYLKIKEFEKINTSELYSIKLKMKKLTKKFTNIKFNKKLNEIL